MYLVLPVLTLHRDHDHISLVSKYTVCNCSCIIDCLHAAKDLSVLKHVMKKYIIIVFPHIAPKMDLYHRAL